MLPYLTSRSIQLNQEFAFFPSAPPHAQGGLFELRTYQLKPGTLLEWENTWFVFTYRPSQKSHYLLTGEVVSKHAVNLLPQLEPGSLKLGDFIKCTISGNTRAFLYVHLRNAYTFYRNLEARKETREKAWQIDGWAETVSKVRVKASYLDIKWMVLLSDGSARQFNGLVHSCAPLFQPT